MKIAQLNAIELSIFIRKPLVVLSFDGFKRSYTKNKSVKTLEHMAKCGTTAEYMYGVYPTKTFPNHYTIATGLYPESHGIVDNVFFEKQFKNRFAKIRQENDEKYSNVLPVVNWLGLPASKRPALIMTYFDQPDAKVTTEMKNVEMVLSYLFETLYKMEILNCINIIVLSDHDKMMETVEQLKCFNNTHYRMYDRYRIPKRYHFSMSNRIGDIILDGQLGTTFYQNYAADYNKTHDHGYDYILPSMHTIFYAYGPNIARGLITKPFQNIELFNLMIALLNINSNVAPSNNGTKGRLNSVLDGILLEKPKRVTPLDDCDGDNDEQAIHENFCLFGLSLLVSGYGEMCYVSNCSSASESALIQKLDSIHGVALVERINADSSVVKTELQNESIGWIETSLSAKGANDLKVYLHSNFAKGHFANLQEITSYYAKVYNEIVVISGPIYDFSNNGTFTDPLTQIHPQYNTTPTHIFRAIFRCNNSDWLEGEMKCENTKSLHALSFILPNAPDDYNCLARGFISFLQDSLSYLIANTARLRDIELLTGLEFLPSSWTSEEELYDDDFSLTLRTMMPEHLWLEKKLK
uniref:Uncharacterized protein n=1 Tax=Setaria digitata TaxID=48799 RepID=A0A915Q2S6_9BILA